jgi:hypothetical protein
MLELPPGNIRAKPYDPSVAGGEKPMAMRACEDSGKERSQKKER